MLQDVICEKHLLYFLLSKRPLFKHEDHTFEILSKFYASAAIYRMGWGFDFFFSLS